MKASPAKQEMTELQAVLKELLAELLVEAAKMEDLK
jgi:hypothetical protein